MHSRNGMSAASKAHDTSNLRVDVNSAQGDNGPHPHVCTIDEAVHIAETTGKAAAVDRARQALRLGVQFLLLVALSQTAELIVTAMHLPLPSNAVGMLALFLMLHYGVLHLGHVDAGAALFVRHLAFFFIPIAVGLMAYRELLASTGVALLFVIAVSALVGMLVAGLVAQRLKGLHR